jgi:hypothetical protein
MERGAESRERGQKKGKAVGGCRLKIPLAGLWMLGVEI